MQKADADENERQKKKNLESIKVKSKKIKKGESQKYLSKERSTIWNKKEKLFGKRTKKKKKERKKRLKGNFRK